LLSICKSKHLWKKFTHIEKKFIFYCRYNVGSNHDEVLKNIEFLNKCLQWGNNYKRLENTVPGNYYLGLEIPGNLNDGLEITMQPWQGTGDYQATKTRD
jgi:hypothetical protein